MSYELTFTDLLEKAGYNLADVRLIRHQENGHAGMTPYSWWVTDPETLVRYQSLQGSKDRSYLTGDHWAAFVKAPDDQTLFVGLFDVAPPRLASDAEVVEYNRRPLNRLAVVGQDDFYHTTLSDHLASYIGRLVIDWGSGKRSWRQRADSAAGRSKTIVELKRTFGEPAFPGFDRFVCRLSEVVDLPVSWRTALRAVGGIYLLTCPRTKEQYVGLANGADGFLGRWLEYAHTGDGGNVRLRSRDPADYQISILELFGSSLEMDPHEIARRENLWKDKLQSRAMGLNAN